MIDGIWQPEYEISKRIQLKYNIFYKLGQHLKLPPFPLQSKHIFRRLHQCVNYKQQEQKIACCKIKLLNISDCCLISSSPLGVGVFVSSSACSLFICLSPRRTDGCEISEGEKMRSKTKSMGKEGSLASRQTVSIKHQSSIFAWENV